VSEHALTDGVSQGHIFPKTHRITRYAPRDFVALWNCANFGRHEKKNWGVAVGPRLEFRGLGQ